MCNYFSIALLILTKRLHSPHLVSWPATAQVTAPTAVTQYTFTQSDLCTDSSLRDSVQACGSSYVEKTDSDGCMNINSCAADVPSEEGWSCAYGLEAPLGSLSSEMREMEEDCERSKRLCSLERKLSQQLCAQGDGTENMRDRGVGMRTRIKRNVYI